MTYFDLTEGAAAACCVSCGCLLSNILHAVKLWYAVRIHGSEELQMVTFTGQKTVEVIIIG